jgi:hypothetical protein
MENIVLSRNGIIFNDPKPLRYCTLYGTIISPTLKECRQCSHGSDVLKITQEKREMFLDSRGDVNETNQSGKDDQVTASLVIATIKPRGKPAEKQIVRKIFENAVKCPRDF